VDRRETLPAKAAWEDANTRCIDIRLQGEAETFFFDL
jgi:protocatechuate 3,4-dioxygenase beta subunit